MYCTGFIDVSYGCGSLLAKWIDVKGVVNAMNNEKVVFIVYGAPGSGKTTFVKDSLMPGDIVVDLDVITAALLGTENKHPDYATVMPLVLSVRDSLYTMIEARVGLWMRAFVISASPDERQISQLADRLGASCIYMDITEDECLRRVMNDPARPDKNKAGQIVKEWFYKHRMLQQFAGVHTNLYSGGQRH